MALTFENFSRHTLPQRHRMQQVQILKIKFAAKSIVLLYAMTTTLTVVNFNRRNRLADAKSQSLKSFRPKMMMNISILFLYALAVELCDVMRQTSQKPTFEIFNHDVFGDFFTAMRSMSYLLLRFFTSGIWSAPAAVCGSVLQCVAVCRSVLQCVAVCFSRCI